jgi:hypothetical protein
MVVKPAENRSDGSPILGEGQVFVMKTGTLYHTRWCNLVARKWDEAPRGPPGDHSARCRTPDGVWQLPGTPFLRLKTSSLDGELESSDEDMNLPVRSFVRVWKHTRDTAGQPI